MVADSTFQCSMAPHFEIHLAGPLICLGIENIRAMDPYHDIDPLVNESNIAVARNLEAVCQLNQDQFDLFHTREDKDEDDDDAEDVWEREIQTSNALNIFQDFDDKQSL